jgi:hypothetical protein
VIAATAKNGSAPRDFAVLRNDCADARGLGRKSNLRKELERFSAQSASAVMKSCNANLAVVDNVRNALDAGD